MNLDAIDHFVPRQILRRQAGNHGNVMPATPKAFGKPRRMNLDATQRWKIFLVPEKYSHRWSRSKIHWFPGAGQNKCFGVNDAEPGTAVSNAPTLSARHGEQFIVGPKMRSARVMSIPVSLNLPYRR